MSLFEQKLREIINGHSLENESDTPDFILAEYMIDCLDAFTDATNKRDKWYGREANQCPHKCEDDGKWTLMKL